MNKTKFKAAIFIFSCVITLAVMIYIKYVYKDRDYSERMRIDAMIDSFLAIKSAAEEGFQGGVLSIDADKLHQKWRMLNNGNGQNVTSLVVGSHGEIIIVSDSLQKVIVFTPLANNTLSWRCAIYPRVSYKTLCDSFQG